jgi:LacI family transcriptional regulator
MPRPPTIRSLARQLRLSTATVSEALRDNPRVHAETRERVQRAARRAGYQPNPLLGAALSAVRRASHQNYRGTVALVDTAEGGRAELMIFHREIVAGAKARAASLGFNTELFWLGEGGPALSLSRLRGVLHARGISGVVLLPFHTRQDMAGFDFSRLAAVQMDHCLLQPHLHTVVPDHYVSMMNALERLTALGYRRIGLCLDQRKDMQLKRKWSAGFQAFFRSHARDTGIPVLVEPQLTRECFLPWFRRYRPDLVVGHAQVMVQWLQEEGLRVPQDIGYFNLNVTERLAPCSGLDLEPRRLGAAAVEMVVAMLHRQEWGVPAYTQTITLEASWVEGPTLGRPGDTPAPLKPRPTAARTRKAR